MLLINTIQEANELGITRYPTDHRNVDLIKIDEVRTFVISCINEHGSTEKLAEANAVCDRLVAVLKFRGLMAEGVQQSFIDLQVAAAMVHNLFYREDDWRTLFDARYCLEEIRERIGMHQQAFDVICRTVECQLGNENLIPELRPNPNTPQELFSDVVFHEKKYKGFA